MELGRKIINLRLDRGIRQQDLARIIGITPSALSKIESGINSPRGMPLFRIARALCVPCEYLLDEDRLYPHEPPPQKPSLGGDGKKTVRTNVTREEQEFLERVRKLKKKDQETLLAIPGLSPETLFFLLQVVRQEAPAGVAEKVERLLSEEE